MVCCLLVALLTGCSNQTKSQEDSVDQQTKSSQSSSNNQASDKSSEKNSSSSKQKVAATPWNHQRDQKLTTFINQWAPTMGQSYQKYDGSTPLDTSVGLKYPASLGDSLVDNNQVSISWSPDGNGSSDYNVVAIYNYDGTEPPLPNRITYVFAFHNGQPVALVDQTRDGEPRLHETENTTVKEKFQSIANS